MKKNELAPVVKSSDGHPRRGKGFSLTELNHAGLNLLLAKKLGIPVDRRRKTSYVENVKKLEEFLRRLEKK